MKECKHECLDREHFCKECDHSIRYYYVGTCGIQECEEQTKYLVIDFDTQEILGHCTKHAKIR